MESPASEDIGGAQPVDEVGGAPAAETGEPPAAEPAPAPRGVAAPTAQAAITSFYAALDDRRFASAWEALSPAVRTAFGGFDGWRAGHSNTISSRPSHFRVTAGPRGATVVEHILATGDRSSCGRWSNGSPSAGG